MGKTTNPFQKSMARLQLPEGFGDSISVSGFNIEADDERCVEVPRELVPQLLAHGLVEVQPKAAATA